MERRRGYIAVGLVAVLLLIAGLVALEIEQNREAPMTAFAPADDAAAPAADSAAPAGGESPAAGDMAAAPADDAKPAEEAAKSVDATGPVDAGPVDAGPGEQTAMAAPDSGTSTEAAAPLPPAETAVEPEPGMPTFDVVRVEPTGDAVLAGQAAPKATVEILDGAKTIATAEADDHGAWAIPLEAPLAPGSHDLAIRTTTEDKAVTTLSDQRVAVSVPEKGSKDVLVVLNTPDAASKVLEASQAPVQAPGTTKDESVAMAAPAAEAPAPADQPAETPAVAEAPTAETPAVAEAPAEVPAQAEQQTVMAEPPVAAEAPVATEPPVAQETAIAAEPAVPAEPPIAAEPPIVADAPATTEPVVPPPAPEVAVTAVEADTSGLLYVAGTAVTGESVRVYLDGKPLGDARPSPSGTWLLEVPKVLQAGNYTVRADQVNDGGAVIARSEVPFERDVAVAILKPAGKAGEQSGANASAAMPEMETVIIKRGDNLWRIARATWGEGMRWSTIYQANTDQIRNPHWIYPGQVFLMPKGDVKYGDATVVGN